MKKEKREEFEVERVIQVKNRGGRAHETAGLLTISLESGIG
jgi:hypothetical protein